VFTICLQVVLWRKPYRNRKPRFFVRTMENRNRGFLEPSEYGFTFRRLCLYAVQSWFRRGDWRYLQSLQRPL